MCALTCSLRGSDCYVMQFHIVVAKHSIKQYQLIQRMQYRRVGCPLKNVWLSGCGRIWLWMSTLHLGNALGSVSMPGQYHIDNRELTAQKNMKCIQHMQQGMRVVGLEEPVRMGQRHRREPCFILAHQLMYSSGTCYVACVCEIRELCHQNGIAHDCTCVIIKCTCVDLVYMIWPQHPFPIGHRHMYKWVYPNLYAE